jgi:hypothetical protein
MLALSLGDSAAARAWGDTLALPDDGPGVLRPHLALSLRAHLAARRGDDTTAVAALDSAWAGITLDHALMSPFAVRPADRWLRGAALARLGWGDEGAGWLASVGEASVWDLPTVAPALRLLAEIRRGRGDAAGARQAQARAEAMWAGADGEMRAGEPRQ